MRLGSQKGTFDGSIVNQFLAALERKIVSVRMNRVRFVRRDGCARNSRVDFVALVTLQRYSPG